MLDLIAWYERFIKSFHSTSPHHKHTGNEVLESTETSVGDVLNRISEKLEDLPKYLSAPMSRQVKS